MPQSRSNYVCRLAEFPRDQVTNNTLITLETQCYRDCLFITIISQHAAIWARIGQQDTSQSRTDWSVSDLDNAMDKITEVLREHHGLFLDSPRLVMTFLIFVGTSRRPVKFGVTRALRELLDRLRLSSRTWICYKPLASEYGTLRFQRENARTEVSFESRQTVDVNDQHITLEPVARLSEFRSFRYLGRREEDTGQEESIGFASNRAELKAFGNL